MLCNRALSPLEEIDIRKFLHLFGVTTLNHLLVIEKNPVLSLFALNMAEVFLDERDVMARMDASTLVADNTRMSRSLVPMILPLLAFFQRTINLSLSLTNSMPVFVFYKPKLTSRMEHSNCAIRLVPRRILEL